MKKLFTTALIVCTLSVFGQSKDGDENIIFYEGFESTSSSLPKDWSQDFLGETNPKVKWKVSNGGGKPAGSSITKPECAHGGNKNACLYFTSVQTKYRLYLISPQINFSGAKKPMLVFWYSQYQDRASFGDTTGVDNFEFSLHYRISNGDWIPFGTPYTQPTDDSEPWKCDSVMLPSAVCDSTKVQIAFLGVTKTVGHGCCIDDVSIIETDVIPRKVESITATHPSKNVMPTNSTDNSIMRLRIKVSGNDGAVKLNSLTATAMNQAAAAVEENGVKLYYTETDFFTMDTSLYPNNTPLDTTSIVNGKAVFSNINRNLPTGSSYLWITCDIKKDTAHLFRNNIVDFRIDTFAIDINGTKYPEPKIDGNGQRTTPLNPIGSRIIAESLFIDNFDEKAHTDTIWTFGGEFERAEAKQPNGQLGGTTGGNPNPADAHSGAYMIGTDITGLGELKGNYEKNIGSNEYYAISKTVNCYYYKDISLMFYRWLNVSNSDTAAVGISLDGGATWNNIWASSSSIQEKDWSFQYLNLNKVADRNPNVKIRFTLGPTRSGLAYSGWNIDDVALVGTYIYKDAALTEILTPNTGCGLGTEDPITIRIKNVGYNDINAKSSAEDSLLVSYKIDGGKWITDTVKENIARNAELLYTFKTKPDLSKFGAHDIVVKVSLGSDANGNIVDEDERNDYAQKTIMTLPYRDVPYAQNFDSISDYWYGKGDTWHYARLSEIEVSNILKYRSSGTWQYGKPSYSTTPCWYTKVVDTAYAAYDSSWLETPCFNMKAMQRPIIEFRLRGNSASGDGLAVYYSVDNGEVWKILPAYANSLPHPNWNWYNTATVAALKTSGWNGKFAWQTVKQLLPDEIAGQDSVKFRFVFASGKRPAGFKGEGFAIDDFSMYESPIDAGIAEIVDPVDACELLKEQPITVVIANFGLRGIIPTDSLIASVGINDKLTLTDTLFVTDTLAVGDTIHHTFSQTVNMWNKKAYRMTAYTQAPGDTMRLFRNGGYLLSGVNNDTLQAVANVLGEPQYDLGDDIGTLDPTQDTLIGGVKTNGFEFEGYKWFATKEAFESGEPTIWEKDTLIGLRAFKLKNDYPELEKDEDEYYYYIEVKSVTDGHECFKKDSIKIINSSIDVGIEYLSGLEVEGGHDFCREREFNDVKVKINIENKSSQEGIVDDDFGISIGYIMLDADSNSVTYIDTTIIYTKDLGAKEKDSFEYTFEKQPIFEYDGLQSIYFKAIIWADVNPKNNIDTVADVTVWLLPTVDLGDDIIMSANPKLDSIVLMTDYIDGATYSWLNYTDSVKNTFMVTDSVTKEYKVNVTDEHGCATVKDSVLIVTDDWALTELVSPIDQCEPQFGMDVAVKLVNNSHNKYGAGYRIPALISVNNISQRDTIVLSDSVFAFDTIEYMLTAKADLPAMGQFPVNVKIAPTYDINRADTSNSIFEYVNVWGVPRLDLGKDTIFTLQPETITLDAGSVVDSTDFSWFKWNKKNEYKDQTYNVLTSDNICYVFAMNEHGCLADDQKISIYDDQLGNIDVASDTVIIITTDVEFDEIITPTSSCDITSSNVLTIDIRNNGLSAIKNGTELPVKVKINDNAEKTVTFKLKEQFKVGATTQLSMPFENNFNNDGVYVVRAWLDWNLDRFNDNDTATITVSQFPHPNTFSLGDDIYTTQPDTITLQAPENQYYYYWSNGLKGDTVDAITLPNAASTSYSVRVFNEYNCTTSDTMSVFTYDLEFSAFTNAKKGNSNSCEPIENAVVHGKISVKSLDVIPAGTNMTANFDFDGKNENHDITLIAPINKDKPYTFDFNTRISIPDTGNYVIKSGMTVNNLREADTANFKETEFRIGTYPIPFEDTVSTRDNIYTIDAGNLFTVFDWYTEQHHDGQTLTVVKTGDYKLLATDINGCKAKDSTYVLFIKPQYDITGVAFDTTYCESDGTATIAFYLKNTGNDIIASGSQTQISYQNDSVKVDEVFTFDKTLKAGDSILVAFKQKADFSSAGKHQISISADIAGFIASAVISVSTFELPTIHLGDDINSLEQSVTLSAVPGYSSYLWNTNDTTPSIDVTSDGKYWVSVVNYDGCANSDTVNVHFIPTTITITEMKSPVSQCGSITNDSIVIEILNNGDATIQAGQKIGVKCTIDNTTIYNTIQLPWDFGKNATYTHKMDNSLTLNAIGSHSLKFALDVDGLAKDSSEYMVEVYALPEFKFDADTIRTEKYPYVLSPAPLAGATYRWNTNETTESIEINVDGKYQLTITDSNHCQALDSVVVIKINEDTTDVNPGVSINDLVLNDIAIYPNPANDVVNIDFNGAFTTGCKIMVARASGQIIFASAQTSDIMKIDVSDWAQGIYLIQITNGNESRIIKFVKE